MILLLLMFWGVQPTGLSVAGELPPCRHPITNILQPWSKFGSPEELEFRARVIEQIMLHEDRDDVYIWAHLEAYAMRYKVILRRCCDCRKLLGLRATERVKSGISDTYCVDCLKKFYVTNCLKLNLPNIDRRRIEEKKKEEEANEYFRRNI